MVDAPNTFEAPTEFTNVVLIIEGKKLHVNKDFLAIHSPVFAAMFYGDFAEKGKNEVEIKEVVYQEFVDLLNMIHPGYTSIKDSSVSHILKLADQFQMKDACEQSEKFLMKTEKVNMKKKMEFAAQYNLEKLMFHCCKSITCINQMKDIQSLSTYLGLSYTMKATMCDRMMDLLFSSNNSACPCHTPSPSNQVSTREEPRLYSPTAYSTCNVILNVEGKKLHAYKGFLAIHSPVFAAMFLEENGMEEVEIKNVVYEEFIDLLNLIYPGSKDIAGHSIFPILALADRFKMMDAREHILKSIKCAFGLRLLKSSPQYAHFSNEMKMAIFERMLELVDASSAVHSSSCRCGR